MNTDPDAEHIRSIYERQAQQEQLEKPPPRVSQYLGGPKQSNEQPLGQRIAQTAARLSQQISDPNLQAQIVAKIARAIEEGRIPEGEIAQIMACMHLAKNRGAYFVAAAKKAFGRNKLSWHTEDWR
jgi:truncated hemoglobin YjbI